jgi:pilus assembly protein Flp/PilA
MKRVIKLLKDRRGASAIEYALVASLISVAAMAGYSALGSSVAGSFNNTSDTISGQL